MIYLVRAGDFYKIGFSDQVEQRVTYLQGANPVDLELIDSWEGSRQEENIIHDHFRDKRVRGEWYRFDENDLCWLRSTKPAKKENVPPFRIRLKNVGCPFCGRYLYYESKPHELTCECGYSRGADEEAHGKKLAKIQSLIKWARNAHASSIRTTG